MTTSKIKTGLFVEDFRPQTLDDCILPATTKKQFKEFVKRGEITGLLFSGSQGSGKTATARALCNDLGCDSLIINCSEDCGIDVLRTKIRDFASTVSMDSDANHKVIILDEADFLSPTVQAALRGFIEEFYSNARFIFTCNYLNKIIEPLHSRCAVIKFSVTKEDKPKMALAFYKRVINILEENEITFDQNVLVKFVNFHFPDMRRTLNELQKYSMTGTIDAGILSTIDTEKFEKIITHLKNKDFKSMRSWVTDSGVDSNTLFSMLYDTAYKYIEPGSIPGLVMILAQYQYQAGFALNTDINTAACFVEIMSEVSFK